MVPIDPGLQIMMEKGFAFKDLVNKNKSKLKVLLVFHDLEYEFSFALTLLDIFSLFDFKRMLLYKGGLHYTTRMLRYACFNPQFL